MVLLVSLVGVSLEMRERGPEENENMYEPRAAERRSALPGSIPAEDGLQHQLSR